MPDQGCCGLLWLMLVFGIPVLFILTPLATFLIYGFWQVEEGEIITDFSLGNYRDFLANESYRRVFLSTLSLALQVTLINLVLGYAVAYFVSAAQRCFEISADSGRDCAVIDELYHQDLCLARAAG